LAYPRRGLTSGKIVNEARDHGVKLVARFSTNFVVKRFGIKFRKEDIFALEKPIILQTSRVGG